MSSYAALVSLSQILGTLLRPGRLLIIRNRSQLQSLHDKALFLLHFLGNSTTCSAALETKLREAAYEAEDLVEFQIYCTLDSSLRETMKFTILRFPYPALVLMISSIFFPTRFTHVKAIPPLVQLFMLRVVIPILAAVATCMIAAPLLHLYVSIFLTREEQRYRRLLYDFDVIIEMVKTEACPDTDISAHAALISLQQILDCGGDSICRNRGQFQSLHQKVSFLLDFLGNASLYMTNHKSELEIVEVKTRDAVYKAKALIEFQIPAQFTLDSDRRSFCGLMKVALFESLPVYPVFYLLTIVILKHSHYGQMLYACFPQMIPLWIRKLTLSFVALVICISGVVIVLRFLAPTNTSGELENQELRLVINDFSTIERNVIEIKDACGNPSDLHASAASPRLDCGGTSRDFVVGLDSGFEAIRDRLAQNSSKLEVVSIVGMGGIGKTTLARKVYNDPCIIEQFNVRAWITVTQEYSLRQVLLDLLDSAKMLTNEIQGKDDDGLAHHLYQNLIGRRYLIVMDDVWQVEIWDFMRRYFPKDGNGSRVILTSRESSVASYPDPSSPLHQMQCLSDTDSWYLLKEKVYGAGGCPPEEESIGREIARCCAGLPLAIVVIAGILLYKAKPSRIETAKNINSKLRQSARRHLEIPGLSYNHLPHHLKPCFLYVGAFLGDGEIPVSRLISLWVAEGFLKPSTSKTLEEVAEDNLKDLIDRNLILVCKRSCDGKIKTCRMHSLLRDISQQQAHKENFLHVVGQDGYVTTDRQDDTPRRLSIRSDALRADARHDLISRYHWVRSLLCTSKLFDYQPAVYLGFVYLRVVDLLVIHFSREFPEPIIKLVLLRYLAIYYDGPLPPSMSKLHNLETIIHHHCSFQRYPLLPRLIWSLTNLRHLYVKPGCYLSDPLGFRLPWKSSALEQLQTLVGIRNFRWSKGIIKRVPNLKKLGISYDVSSGVDLAAYQLESLVDLIQLESLKIIIKCNDEGSGIPPKLAFPQKLKKLSLSGSGIPWASMAAIGSALPNLEALKLRCEACCGSTWETVEGGFPQLKFLLLEDISLRSWETEADHFPRLQRLVINSCDMLEKIPSAVGDIPTLAMMELVDCHSSAVESAKEIQEEQESMGNEGVKVCISQNCHLVMS